MIKAVVDALSSVAGAGPAQLHQPEFAGSEWDYVKECLDTGWVSSAGSYVDNFEDALSDFTGADHAVATVNGTSALHTCLMLAGVKPGDEVIVPALTFVATANAVAYCGATPHFADCEEQTLGLDPDKLDQYLKQGNGKKVAAVVCVHTFGHPVDLDCLVEVCRKHNLPLIEDAAESLGSYYKGRHTGNDGLLSALSFNGNKIITTGGGGAVLTNDEKLAKAAKHLTTTAKLLHPWEYVHDQTGYNYRMPNINAALGLAQIEQLPGFIEKKRRLADSYHKFFADIEGISFFTEPEDCTSNYWLNVLILAPEHAALRDDMLSAAVNAGVGCRPAWMPMHMLQMYKDCPRMDLSVAEDLYRRLINIPSSPVLAGSRKDAA